MDTKILRQKILDLAIHGRLVPQDANDEPASALLARIRAEKEQLVADGKLKKKDLVTTPVSDEDKPFEVPEGWEWCRIGEIFNLQAGKNVSASDIHEFSQNTPYPCYGGNGIRGYVCNYNKEGLFPIIGRQGALCGNVNFAEGKFYATEHAVVVTCFAKVNVHWARYTLDIMNLNQYATATAQPGLSVATVNEIPIPLPPLAEQQRIVAAVEQWMSLVDIIESGKENLQQSIALAKNKILDLAIKGKLVEKEGEWEEKTLGEVATYINGRAFKPTEWEDAGKPIIRIQNLNDPEAKYNYSSYEHEDKYLVHKGDLLFAWAASLGTYIWDGSDAWLNQHIFKVIPHAFINKKYLNIALDAMIASLYEKSHGSGMVHITRAEFVKISIQVPPLAEQQRIVAKVEELFCQLDNIANALK